MLSAEDVARYFLATQPEDAGESISNLKLQKLCYYAQGFHIALFGQPLFREPINAWAHGPVVPSLYHAYKQFGEGPIPTPDDVDFAIYDEDTRALLDDVAEVYGQFSAWKLRTMTHEEPPWKEARSRWDGAEISHESMASYFVTLVE